MLHARFKLYLKKKSSMFYARFGLNFTFSNLAYIKLL